MEDKLFPDDMPVTKKLSDYYKIFGTTVYYYEQASSKIHNYTHLIVIISKLQTLVTEIPKTHIIGVANVKDGKVTDYEYYDSLSLLEFNNEVLILEKNAVDLILDANVKGLALRTPFIRDFIDYKGLFRGFGMVKDSISKDELRSLFRSTLPSTTTIEIYETSPPTILVYFIYGYCKPALVDLALIGKAHIKLPSAYDLKSKYMRF